MTNWPTKKLGEVCEIISPGIEKFDGVKKYVATADVDFDKIVNFAEITYKNRPSRANMEAEENDVLVARMAETKKFLIADKNLQDNYIFSTGFAVLRVKEELIPRYLFYFLTTKDFNLQKDKLAVGATQKAINNSALQKIKILTPPLNIQQKIVERLDAIKKARELNDKQIQLAEELFQSLLHRELDPKGKNWEVKKLGEVCEMNPKTTLDTKKDKVKYVEMAAIDENLKTIKYLLDRPINKVSSGAPRFTNNDIIFARITPCTENGKIAFVENCKDVCAGSTELHILRAKKDKVLPHFLFYFIITPKIRNMAIASMTGSTGRQRVPAEFFHYLKIPLPPLETQQKIVEKLSAAQEYKKKLLDQKSKLQELFESVLNKSLKGQL